MKHEALERYFRELEGLPLLDAKQERALAAEIEELEVAHWRAILSYRPAAAVVGDAVEPRLPRRASKLDALRKASRAGGNDARRTRTVEAAARQLRELDMDRSAVAAAGEAVRAAFASDRRAQRYLSRVSQAREAHQQAKRRFITANLRLVIAMARRYDPSLLPLADLIQEGNLGLMRAVERYDHRRGFRFSTYAAWWIRHAVNRALSDKARLVRVPVHALDALAQVARASSAIASRTGATPSLAELAVETGMSEDKLELLGVEGLVKHPLSLDRSLGDEREQTLHDVLRDPDQGDPDQGLDQARWCAEVGQLLRVLTPIESAILRFRYGLDDGEELTLREIGDKYNLSRERIRQLQQEALTKLRRTLRQSRGASEDQDGLAA
jgi:RNA polymerase primary sigma factor